MSKVRKPVVAGFFYPSDPQQLKDEVEIFLDISNPAFHFENTIGLISPHAGYTYSGKTAGYAYNLLKGTDYKTVIIISPSHREYFPGVSIYNGEAFETPLGIIPINKNLVKKITSGSEFIFESVRGHEQEHAVEVQLPFLQIALTDFEIVPIVMGDQGRSFVDELASKLADAIDDKTVIVASSDLSHYHPKPEAYKLDSIVEKRIKEFDYNRLQFDLEERVCEACGGGPIVTMMKAIDLLNKKKSIILNRSDSGDTSGDNSEVVGYLSAAVYGE